MAEKVLKGITCPACSGELDLREGIKSFNCKYCGTLLIAKGSDGVIKYNVIRKVNRDQAIQKTMTWLGQGLAKAKGLKNSSKIEDAFLVYIPYWRVRADVIGWVFGKEKRTSYSNGRTQTYYVDVEKKIQQTYDRTYAACDVAELGVRKVNLHGDQLQPVNFEQLQGEGMLFNIVSSEKEITETAKEQFTNEAINTAKVDTISFQHSDLVRPNTTVVYYPLWVVRYVYQNRTYQVVVDGEDGAICYGKAPGNNLYRAITGMIGTAIGTFLITMFGVFSLVGSGDGAKVAFVVYLFAVIFGVIAIKWGYKKFRYGGEVEEGTGIVAQQTAGKKSFTKSTAISGVSSVINTGNVVNIASSILFRR